MGDCNSCPSKGNCSKDSSQCMVQSNPLNKINKIVGVMSGKGGVGKSTVSVTLAKYLALKGYKVGLLDADITGPSTVNLLNLNGKRAMASADGNIIPVESSEGIKVISLNLMVDDENQPVIWRGALLSSCVKQFWTDVLWGELDFLIIDMPPGTGDVTLTVMQSIPISGVVMVSIPQDMVSMIVAKSINMAKKMNIKIYGVIENMSYIKCPNCDEKISLYDIEAAKKFIDDIGVDFIGELPTNKQLCNISNEGFSSLDSDIKAVFENALTKF